MQKNCQCSLKQYEILKEGGYEVIPNPFGRKLTDDEVIEHAKDCVSIAAAVEPLTKRVMYEFK